MNTDSQSNGSISFWQKLRNDKAGLPFIKWIVLTISAIALGLFIVGAIGLYLYLKADIQIMDSGFKSQLLDSQIPTYGHFGSFIAGTLGTATAAFGLLLLYVNLRVQMEEFSKSNAVLKQTADINQKSLTQQEHIAETEATFQKKAFLMDQMNHQLDRAKEELDSMHINIFSTGSGVPRGATNVYTSDIFGLVPMNERYRALVKNFDKTKIEEYLTRLGFAGYDVIEFMELGGKYHHRATQFDKLMSLLEPFQKRRSEIVELLAPLDIPSEEFWTLAHTHEKISELRHMQENEIKTNLINKR